MFTKSKKGLLNYLYGYKFYRAGMEGHAFDFKSGIHEFQNKADGAFNGGGGRADDTSTEEEDRDS